MNTLECEVVEILSKPIHNKILEEEWWEVKIKINDYGKITEDSEIFDEKEEAKQLKVGDIIWR